MTYEEEQNELLTLELRRKDWRTIKEEIGNKIVTSKSIWELDNLYPIYDVILKFLVKNK